VVGTTHSYGEPNGDILLYKLDVNGDSLMRIVYGGSSYDGGNSMVILDNGDIVVAGGSESYTFGKMDAFIVKFSANGTLKWKKNYGLIQDDEECYKIIRSASAVLEETIIIYTTNEGGVNKKDIKTIFLNYDGDYYGGFDSGKFGFLEDDEAFDISVCKDKGYIQVGYTTKSATSDKDVYLVKQDSILEEWFQVVGIEEEREDVAGLIFVYPNPMTGLQKLNVKVGINNALQNSHLKVFDCTGKEIFSLECSGRTDIAIDTEGWPQGIFVLRYISEIGNSSVKIAKY